MSAGKCLLSRTMNTVRSELVFIFNAWNTGVSYSDIYQMIIKWTTDNSKKIPKHLLPELKDTDELKEIVEQFIFGIRYVPLRKYFQVP